ncbi:MAG: hypothetical protein HPY50_00170 [Firmicutes bacterium]|nr:hypothetical protein [Bacillota bacterium]
MFKRLFSRFFKDPNYIGTHHEPAVGRTNANRVLFTPNAELNPGAVKTDDIPASRRRQRQRMRPNRRPKQ